MRLQKRLYAVVLLCGPALMTLVPGTARADDLPSVPQYSVAFDGNLTGPAAGATITCVSDVEYAHRSRHVPETVNVRAWVDCTAPVSRLAVTVRLYYQGVLVSTEQASCLGCVSQWQNAAYFCAPGLWHGDATVSITFPPGFTPPGASHYEIKPAQLITCVT